MYIIIFLHSMMQHHSINNWGIWKRMIPVDLTGPHLSNQPLIPKQDGTNLQRKNYRKWTDSVFLATDSLPNQPPTYWSNTIWNKLPTKTSFEMNYIFPKMRDWVVFKNMIKYDVTKKAYISTLNRINFTGMYNYSDANS